MVRYTLDNMEPPVDWCLIERDPGVFTQLISKFGVKGVQVEELWMMDDSVFEQLRPVHGLIFLYKYMQHEEPAGPVVKDRENVYFAKQTINNACSTQTVISLLMNCKHPDLDIGPELTELKEFTMSFDSSMRGLTLSNCHTIRSAHNSMAQLPLGSEYGLKIAKDENAFHSVGYIPIEGRLYELDGLRDGPIDLGPVAPQQDWLDVVRPIIMKRINRCTESEIRFNVMAIVSDRKVIYERQIKEHLNEVQMLGVETDATMIPRLRKLIEYEDEKMARYRKEMTRRRHDYLPFIIVLLKILSEQKKLMPLLEKAKERAAAKKGKEKKQKI